LAPLGQQQRQNGRPEPRPPACLFDVVGGQAESTFWDIFIAMVRNCCLSAVWMNKTNMGALLPYSLKT